MKTTLQIQNLKCSGCEHTLVNALNKLKGISDTTINAVNHSVTFNHDEEKNIETVQKELSRLGYPVYGDTNTLTKKARSYVSCAIGKMST